MDGILNGIYNVGFIQQELTDMNIDSLKIGGDKIIMVAGKDYNLAIERNVYTIDDIAEERLILIKITHKKKLVGLMTLLVGSLRRKITELLYLLTK